MFWGLFLVTLYLKGQKRVTMRPKRVKAEWKNIKFDINLWVYNHRLKKFADEHGMSIRAAIRYIINQFFKDKPLY